MALNDREKFEKAMKNLGNLLQLLNDHPEKNNFWILLIIFSHYFTIVFPNSTRIKCPRKNAFCSCCEKKRLKSSWDITVDLEFRCNGGGGN